MSHGTDSIQDCCVLLKVKARCAVVQSVSDGDVRRSHLYSAFNGVAVERALRFCIKPFLGWGSQLQPPAQHSSVSALILLDPSHVPGAFSASGPLPVCGRSRSELIPLHLACAVPPRGGEGSPRKTQCFAGGCCGQRTDFGEAVQTLSVSQETGQVLRPSQEFCAGLGRGAEVDLLSG